MRILVVEPDALLADIYRQVLERAGFAVNVAATAQAAIHAADDKLPDVIVLEMQLVGHSGIEFLYELRSYTDWQQIPVIVLSNVPPGEFMESWSLLKDELGVQDYMYKPQTSLTHLLRVVREYSPVA